MSFVLFGTLNDEIRAFLHIAGIEIRQNVYGDPILTMNHEGVDWVLWLHRGDVHTIEYWQEVARQAFDRRLSKIVPGNYGQV